MQSWVDRRRRKHKNFTSDELWAKIKTNWPNMTNEEYEAIYQGVRM